uniref:Uncharacterized protein n=1 Tax=Anguilla anguilla TaxID=7936 RepID=A0A0E9SY87_ANGAN
MRHMLFLLSYSSSARLTVN